MSTFALLQSGFSVLMEPYVFFMVVMAIVMGTIFGALPGVSSTMAVALGLPFTYSMEPVPAIVFLVAIYCSAITGGSITAILFKIPGVPSSAPTTFDGYPMAQRGEAGKALGVALGASAIGGLVSAFCMLLLSPQLTQAALSFGPSDLFAITFMGLSILACLDSSNILRTIISGLIGLLLACVGQDKMYAVQRMTFGSKELLAGLEMIPVLIGIFAVTEVLKQTRKSDRLDAKQGVGGGHVDTKMPSLAEWLKIKWVVLRCSIIGTIIGILPGAGATIASFLCYSTETKLSKHPEKFGTGIIDGIAASESANNAATGGAMVPVRLHARHQYSHGRRRHGHRQGFREDSRHPLQLSRPDHRHAGHHRLLRHQHEHRRREDHGRRRHRRTDLRRLPLQQRRHDPRPAT